MKLFCLLPLAWSAALLAQDADTVLINGKILTADAQFSTQQALAVRDGKITAVGSTAQIRKLAGEKTRVIDLSGRTVIPGLIDSHMHAIRAASFFASESNWAGVPSLAEALNRIRESAKAKRPGEWVIVGGGWKPEQFKEHRLPTQAELTEAAGDHPAYVQMLYALGAAEPARVGRFKYQVRHGSSGRWETRPRCQWQANGWYYAAVSFRCLTVCRGRRWNNRWKAPRNFFVS